MVISKIIGGLGNQLFQYCCGRSLAIQLNTTLGLDISDYKFYRDRKFELNYFSINASIAGNNITPYNFQLRGARFVNNFLNLIMDKPKVIKEYDGHLNPLDLHESRDYYLIGYWQSLKYFSQYWNILKSELEINLPLSMNAENLANEINSCESVSMHIRRGDYLANYKNQSIYSTCDLDYYRDAVELIRSYARAPKLFIFSDDQKWVREKLKFNIPYSFIETGNSLYDFKLMSLCKHNIIANSTYSWWAAFLNKNTNAHIVSPENWFVEGSGYNMYDLIPLSWSKLKV